MKDKKQEMNNTEAKEKAKTAWEKIKVVFRKIGRVFGIIGKVLFHLRKIFLAVPVVWAAFRMYAYGMEHLPEDVGVWLLENGEYQYTLVRESALMSCMAVTAAGLVLMFCSRRTIYPWIISIFTLVLPILLIVTNMYPS